MAKKKKKNKNLNKKLKKEQPKQPEEDPVEDNTKDEVVSEAVDILEAMAATLGQPATTHPPEVRIEETEADENDVRIPYDAAARLAYDGVVEENVDYATFRVKFEANAVAEVIAKRQPQQSTTTKAAAPAATPPAAAAAVAIAPPAPPPVDTAAGTPTTTTTTKNPPQIASSADEAAIADVGDRAYLILQDLGVF